MDEPRLDELRNRITILEREKRRWKAIGVTSLVVLALVLFLGCAGYVGTGVLVARYKQLQEEKRAADQAREEVERAKEQAKEKARENGK